MKKIILILSFLCINSLHANMFNDAYNKVKFHNDYRPTVLIGIGAFASLFGLTIIKDGLDKVSSGNKNSDGNPISSGISSIVTRFSGLGVITLGTLMTVGGLCLIIGNQKAINYIETKI